MVSFVSLNNICRICDNCDKLATVDPENKDWYILKGKLHDNRLDAYEFCEFKCLNNYIVREANVRKLC